MATLKGIEVTLTELCRVFGIAELTAHQWLKDGCPFLEQGGQRKAWRFNSADVYKWQMERRIQQEVAKIKGPKPGVLDPAHERARKDKEMADAAALKNAVARRELIPAGEMVDLMTDAFVRVRTLVLAMPARIAPQVAALDDALECQEILTNAAEDALRELASTEVVAAGGTQPGNSGRGQGGVGGSEPPAQADHQ